MKKLLTLFSAFVLGSGSVFGVVSCRTRPKHNIDDEEVNANKDLDILNRIKKETEQTFEAWWDIKAAIDINDYPEQIPFFAELVNELKKENDGLTLTGETISKYRFLTQLFAGFKAEFANLNQSLRDRYSNYYVDTMPMLLADNDISFTLYNINFDNIVDLLEATSQAILGITVRVNIAYDVKFKGLQARANIEALVVITNDLVALDNIQDNIEKYFTNFVHNTFQKENYKIVWNRYHNNITDKQAILPIIQKVLKNKNILFFSDMVMVPLKVLPFPRDAFLKEHSVLVWAGEAYDADKLTPENFLNFYKKTYISNNIKEDENYYILFTFDTFTFKNAVIENLPFKKSIYIKLEEQLKIVMVKDVFDYQLEEFAKVVMEFWHCFKLETYYENYRLVFKVNQAVFDKVLNSASVLKKNLEIGHIGAIFTPIFNFFNKRTSDLQGTLKGADAVNNNLKYKVNYTKNEKSLTIKLLHKGRVYSYNDISLNYFTFMNNEFNFYYSFFINVMWKDINVDNNKYSFLQIIEFQVILNI